VPNVVRASKAAILATLIAMESQPPITWSVVRVIRPAEADLFSVSACERKVVLSIVVQNVVRGGPRPHPVTILRKKLDYNGIASFVSHLEGHFACPGQPNLDPNE
jgi:hypothetical protein